MRILLRMWSAFVIAIRRLLSQPGLTLAALFGLIMAVTLVISIPLYADAVYYRIFERSVLEGDSEDSRERPPFTFLFTYFGGVHGTLQWEDVQPVDEYLIHSSGTALGLPQQLFVRYFRTEPMSLFPTEETAFLDPRSSLLWTSLAFLSDLENHVKVVEGRFPETTSFSNESSVEVMVSEMLATEMGFQVGEKYILFARDRLQTGEEISTQIPVLISGIWQPADPQEEYWFITPQVIKDFLLVPEESFIGRIGPYLPDEVYTGMWYMVMDGASVHADDVESLLNRIAQLKSRAAALSPDIRLSESPVESLFQYRTEANLLTTMLYAFSVPMIGLILAFIGLVANISVEYRRNEISVLRSRGATVLQVLGSVATESLSLGVITLAISLFTGIQITRVIARTRSFLDFGAPSDLRIGITQVTLFAGIVTIGMAMLAQFVPVLNAARHSIVTYKQQRARMLRPPWWQRVWLDGLLAIPAGYGAYLLRQQGQIAIAGDGQGYDPFRNPLLFLVPALSILALTLFFLRLMPKVMAVLSWLASRSKSVGFALAARHLARSPGLYHTPLILLIFTLSLSAFTASLAETLDSAMHDRMYYRIGSDMRFLEVGEPNRQGEGMYGLEGVSAGVEEGPSWFFFPVSEYLKVPGVRSVAQVGNNPAHAQFGDDSIQQGTFIGINRIDFPQVAFWRRDFASESLGALMNALAVAPDGVLLPVDYMNGNAIRIGQRIRIFVDTYGQRNELDMRVVGNFNLFPTWYPQEGPLFVGNLDYLFQQAGGQFPYRVWLRTDPGFDPRQIAEGGLQELNVRMFGWDSSIQEIAEEQQRPERQGLFGFLSVGFIAAAVLTVLGFLLYALFSFRRRFIELGVMRAEGLSIGQMTSFLAWELIFLVLVGVVIGTGLGASMSKLFIPYLQIGLDPSELIPPFVVKIAWPAILRIYSLFGGLFVATLVALVYLLRRMKIYEAVKLGETA